MQIGAVSIHLPFRRITIQQSPRWILIKCSLPPPPVSSDLMEKKREKKGSLSSLQNSMHRTVVETEDDDDYKPNTAQL